MNDTVRLLSRAANFAVVHLPGRKFPGVVVQGDTLHSLVLEVARAIALAQSGEMSELLDALEVLSDPLVAALRHYEHVCERTGTELPYAKRGGESE